MKRFTLKLLCLFLITGLTGCGTIIHPERRGQHSTQLDPSIVILDSIGLLFFFIPGVIAFAVDFATGTIYLPQGKKAYFTSAELEKIKRSGLVNIEALAFAMQTKTDLDILLNSADLQVSYLSSVDQLAIRFENIPKQLGRIT